MNRDQLFKLAAVFAVVLVLALLGKAGLLPAFTAWLSKIITAALVPG